VPQLALEEVAHLRQLARECGSFGGLRLEEVEQELALGIDKRHGLRERL